MAEVVPYLLAFGGLIAVMAFFTWLKRLVLRRGLSGSALRGALASYEEAMRITSHESHIEIRAQADRQAPAFDDDPRWTGRTLAGANAVRTRRSSGPVRSGRPVRRRRLRRLRRQRVFGTAAGPPVPRSYRLITLAARGFRRGSSRCS
ncbi:hypothetical protein [Streptomyces mesophilus]|uniref:hypothetical protein n=1 Tax=Streptomyces mesophilus TaxID=1775132 RepID=UPI003333FAC2